MIYANKFGKKNWENNRRRERDEKGDERERLQNTKENSAVMRFDL